MVTFAILVLIAEVVGRSLTAHVDRVFHVAPMAPPDASYYPFLLVGRQGRGRARARRAARPGDPRTRSGRRGRQAARRRSAARTNDARRDSAAGSRPRIWAASFAGTSVLYLVHADADGIAAGRWPLIAPWLHTYALPIFAVLAVAIAVVWRFASWLYEVEEYAERTIARVRRIIDDVQLVAARGVRTRLRRLGAPAPLRPLLRVAGLLRCPPEPRAGPEAAGDSVVRHATEGAAWKLHSFENSQPSALREAHAREPSHCSARVTIACGLIWAILQPYRVTLLHPRGQGLWWLVFEPPLFVALAGVVFAVVVARPLLARSGGADAAPR